MKTLAFPTREAAAARSRAEWQKVLGRPKRPEDVTEFLWSIDSDAPVLRVEDADVGRLTAAERRALVETDRKG